MVLIVHFIWTMQKHVLLLRNELKWNFRNINFIASTKTNASHGYQLYNCSFSHQFPQHYWFPALFKHWWHGHASCTVAYPSWSRMVDLPNSHGIPRIRERQRERERVSLGLGLVSGTLKHTQVAQTSRPRFWSLQCMILYRHGPKCTSCHGTTRYSFLSLLGCFCDQGMTQSDSWYHWNCGLFFNELSSLPGFVSASVDIAKCVKMHSWGQGSLDLD